ncbi:MAG: hypothetical protein ACPGXZ_11285 [Saprospiraceae bacterium]
MSKWFQFFKYSVYTFLFTNIFLFLRKETIAATHRFPDGYDFGQIIEVFPSTIDTAAWFGLLMLFELETWIISDENLKKGYLRAILKTFSLIFFSFVLYSFWGYVAAYFWLIPFESVDLANICDVSGQSWMTETDKFETISSDNCGTLVNGDALFKYQGEDIYTDNSLLKSAYFLAIVGIINSLAWILVVVVLEIDVWLQLKNRFVGKAFRWSNFIKKGLYAILFIAAIYWGINGKFLDFWDAFMWIVAFFFIEMNLSEWKKETSEAQE